MNKFYTISLSAVAAIYMSGCSTFTKIKVDEKKLNYKEVHQKKYEELPAIQEVTTNNYFTKVESLNHNIQDIELEINISNKSLKEVVEFIPMNVTLDLEFEKILIQRINHSGSLKDLLNKIAESSNLYWSVKNNIIKFSRTKVVVYKFPIFSAEKLNLIFNITSDDANGFNVGSIKTDVFDEIKISLDNIAKEHLISGSYEKNEEESLTQEILNSMDTKNNLRNEILDRKMKEFSSLSNMENSSSVSNQLDETKVTKETNNVVNGFNRNNKKPKVVAKKDAAPSKMLEYDIRKDSQKNSNNENILANNNNNLEKSNGNELNSAKNSEADNGTKTKEKNVNKENRENSSIVTKITNIYKKTINPEKIDVSVLKESGMVIVNVDKNYEDKVDVVLESITKNILSNMVVLDLYIVEANVNKLKNLKSEISGTYRKGDISSVSSLGSTGLTFSKDSLTNALANLGATTTPFSSSASIVSSLINYTTEDGKTKVLTNPKVLSIPNIPSRIKSSKDIPYLEINSLGGAEEGPDMSVEFVHEGTDIAILTNVYGDDIFLSLGVKLNKYLGDKSINAGTLGVFDIPIQSPRTLNTTFRMKAGDITVLGGMSSLEYIVNDNNQMGLLPTNVGEESKDSELLIIAAPRLIRYVKAK